MSTDWNVHCIDCKDTHSFADANHRDDVMLALCRHADAIAAIADLMVDPAITGWDIEIRTPWGAVDASWFRKHLSHNIVPIDEYGAILNQCWKWVTCECGANHRCALDRHHEGKCQR